MIKKISKNAIFGVIGALVLICAVFCVINTCKSADAAPSPSLPTASSNGLTFSIQSAKTGDISKLNLSSTGLQAQGVVIDSAKGESCVANFSVSSKDGDSALSNYTGVSFSVGAEKANAVANKDVRIYVTHHDGSSETLTGKFNNAGVVNFTVDKLSVFSIVTAYDSSASNQTGSNTSSTSPKTGIF